ncbi:hypothetical protein [Snodgrassella alvi]|uniref:hypothetical protein n=1 Tax=Snodgrassella alvi TaxID=1196083 RepID=UPI000CAC8C9D|nr:hypothetical protein [Snodgrassella alvi]PIT40232.1 hypothetical protein BHC53_08205 [Snodgrassella alvi]
MTMKIILGMPKSRDIYLQIKKNLEFYGFEVLYIDNFPDYIKYFKYQGLKEQWFSLVQKIFYRNFSYKTKLKEQLLLTNTEKLLFGKEYDYTLIIRPDLYPLKLLKLIKKYTKGKFIAYQWDGLRRMPCTKQTIELFDNFFVFDASDVNDKNYDDFQLTGITNFYFDMYHPKVIKHEKKIAYFVGTHVSERVVDIEYCAVELIKNDIDLKFIIPTSNLNKIGQYKHPQLITFGSEHAVSFSENIQTLNEIDIIVDFVNPLHHGLSFRVFEALYYQKKLITNNENIRQYEFYHPDNILIWHKDDLSRNIKDFLKKPYIPLDEKIVKKYGFGNWIKNILDLPHYEKIKLPFIN